MSGDAQIRWQALPPLLLVVLFAAGSFWWFPYPLSGERLPQRYVGGTPLARVQQAEARLWQDPFAAIYRSQEHHRDHRAASEAESKRGLDWLGQLAEAKCRDADTCQVLGAMVFGGPYTGAQEFRRATRYSVLAALSRQGFIAEDTEHIGWINPSTGRGTATEETRETLPTVMPFEWFTRAVPDVDQATDQELRQQRNDRLLLLWLDEDALTREFFAAGSARPYDTYMLPRLAEILHPFLDPETPYALQIIGPASSGTLSLLSREWLKPSPESKDLATQNNPIPAETAGELDNHPAQSDASDLSLEPSRTAGVIDAVDNPDRVPQATQAGTQHKSSLRTQALSDERDRLRRIRWLSATATSSAAWHEATMAKQTGLSIKRMIATDKKLAKLLVHELQVRGLKRFDTVALVGQIDTAYSRDLITMLKEQLAAVFRYGSIQIVTAHYFRGIDGSTPSNADESSTSKDKAGQGSNAKTADLVERPEGQSQVDYLRRLTSELARQHQAYKPAGQIRAIGILGNDYHDKLLVLKALRRAFPDAVFFTTDLSAAMLHPVDNRDTRNLIVASAFGLELEPALQAGVAPFRSSYGTGTYLATRLALEQPPRRLEASSGEERLIDSQKEIDKRIKPLLFEIGRTEAIRLNNPTMGLGPDGSEQGMGCGPRQQNWIACPDWQPARDNRPNTRTILGFLIATLSALTLSADLSKRFRRFLLGHWRMFALGAALVGMLTAALIAGLPSPLGEPFSWVEGVSIWPSEFLRLGALMLAVTLFFAGIRHLRLSDQAIDARFFRGASAGGETLNTSPAHEEQLSTYGVWQLYRARQFPVSALSRLLSEGHTNVVPSWLTRHFVLRNLKPVGLYLLVGFGLTMALGSPETPARGELVFIVDRVVLITSILSFLMLLFFTLEASRRGVWLVQNLTERSSWPDQTLKRFGWQEGLDRRAFDDYLDVQLIADATEGMQPLVYYPFLIFFLLLLSRTTLFDGWHIPLALYLIFGGAALLLLIAALRVRSVASAAKRRSLERINRLGVEFEARQDAKAEQALVEHIYKIVEGIRRGAYASLTEEPLVRATVGLASGIYAIALLEWSSIAGF